jgi:hypothetical protein
VSSGSSENGNNAEPQNASAGNSPAREVQPPQANGQPSPVLLQQPPPQVINGAPQRQSQSPSAPQSRHSSISHPVQPVPVPTPEEKHLQLPLSNATPPFFDQSPPNTMPQPPTLLSPLPTPGNMVNGFMTSTPMSGYDDFVRSGGQSDPETSPFMMDPWSGMPMGTDLIPCG